MEKLAPVENIKLVDCFTFYNELELLEARLHEVYPVVDYIVLVEATKTFTGKNKILYYEENKSRYAKYADKIIHVVTNFAEHYPFERFIRAENADWWHEYYQRNCVKVGLDRLKLRDTDLVMLTDVDEIPRREVLQKLKNGDIVLDKNRLSSLEMVLYYYSIFYTTLRKWNLTRVSTYYKFKTFNQPSDMRICKQDDIILDSGWHISYMGDANFIKNKLESFAHCKDYNENAKSIAYLNECLKKGVFNNEQLIYVPKETNTNLPKFYLEK
jgi:beta-1,4-mannosyl-glycoprotein beta-1,4-N-acetylglucosaminyltransferase